MAESVATMELPDLQPVSTSVASSTPIAEASEPALLGVTRSVLGRYWRARCDARAHAQALAISQGHGTSDLLARVLAGRGVVAADLPGFLEPKLRDLLPDPAVLRDMDEAASRLADAVVRREHVAIFGDYDVDGACSAALLGGYLRRCDTPFTVHIPDRITEGYGPNVEAIRSLRGAGASLLVTVDCGTASHEPLAEAASIGFDTVVLDHHQAPEVLPAVRALVNPNRQDDLSGLGYLAAAGVVFLTLVALNRELRRRGYWRGGAEPNLLGELDLVALATVADVVRLEGVNRAFVRQGLQVMRQRGRPGLTALLDVANLKSAPAAWHLGFLIGPRINAGGRIGDAALGARLLLEADATDAEAMAGTLDQLNGERQLIEREAVAEALAQADATLVGDPDCGVLLAASPAWHPGIVGLVAARLKERFNRPAFAFAINAAGQATGSGRSVAGVDLGRAVRQAVDAGLALKGGGHAMAAGVTIEASSLAAFGTFLGDSLRQDACLGDGDAYLIDAMLTAGGATPELVRQLETAGPFGSGNPEPTFAFARHRLVEVAEVGAAHVRFSLKSGDGNTIRGVAFRAADQPLGQALRANTGRAVHAVGMLAIDAWGGRERVDLRLQDLAPVGDAAG